jgi:HEAT repeat protein
LIKALDAKDRRIRFGAAMALEYFPRQEQDVVPALVKALEGDDCDVRWRAARSIGTLHAIPDLSVPALAKRLRNDPAMNVRCYAIMALAKFGRAAELAVPDLVTATRDSDSVIQSYAKDALKAIESAAAIKANDSKPNCAAYR